MKANQLFPITSLRGFSKCLVKSVETLTFAIMNLKDGKERCILRNRMKYTELTAFDHIFGMELSTQEAAESSFNHALPSTALTCREVMIYYTAEQDLLSECVNTLQLS